MLKAFKDLIGRGRFPNENQRDIIRLSKSESVIALNPVPPKDASGHVKHYYHFIFDLVLPLSLLIEKTAPKVKFVLCDIGLLTPVLPHFFGKRVQVLQDFNSLPKEQQVVDLVGMNPIKVDVLTSDFKSFRESMFGKINFVPTKKPKKILLIERLPSDEFYLRDSKRRGAGATRRSIKNHAELKETIRALVDSKFEFYNVQLENMPFEQQIEYFDSAAVVIAQHGAGLANMIWMQEKSNVVEFGFKSKKHFEKIGSALNIHHFAFDYNERHLEINCTEFSKWLIENKLTRHYFKN